MPNKALQRTRKLAAELIRSHVSNYTKNLCWKNYGQTLFIPENILTVISSLGNAGLSNWTGKGYKIPRSRLKDLSNRQDLKRQVCTDQYFISAARGAQAAGILTSEGFVVLKDSQVASSEVQSTPEAVKEKRKNLVESNIITNWKFTKDCLFSSPSIAAAVVMGRSANGLVEWKNKAGTSIKENQPKS